MNVFHARSLRFALTVALSVGAISTGAFFSEVGAQYGGPARRATARPITLTAPVEGALTARDPTFSDNSHFQVWKFTGRIGQDVVIALDSRDFGAFLMLVAAQGDADQPLQMAMADSTSRTAQFTFNVPSDGDYLIVANTQEARATGRYRLSVKSLADACASGGPCPTAPTPGGLTPLRRISVAGARALTIGAPVAGELRPTDPQLGDSSRFNVWRYDGRAGERLVIDQSSTDFDAYIIMTRQTPEGTTLFRENDDAPVAEGAVRTEHSQLAVELPETGTYLLVATSLIPNKLGRYRLTLRTMQQACAAGGPCEPTAPPVRRTFFSEVLTRQARTIALGDTVNGRITARSGRLGDATFFQAYRFNGTADEEVAIFLSSRSPDRGRLDLYLHVLQPSGDSLNVVKQDDDGGGQQNSLVTAKLPATGEYYLVANGLAAADTGNYSMTVMRLADACRLRRICAIGDNLRNVTASSAVLAVAAEPIVVGTPVNGRFDAQVATLPDGKPFQPWRLTARAGERVVITNRSSDFDAYLVLYSVTGDSVTEIGRDDDGGGGLHAQLSVELATAGDYLVVAGSFSTEARGNYRLSVESMESACAAGGPCSPGETAADTERIQPALTAPQLAFPALDTVRATLAMKGPRLSGRGRYHAYRFRGRANERLVLTMNTDQFDPYLYLARINGSSARLIGFDDDGGPGIHSRLVVTLPADAEYLVVASALTATDTTGYGAYTLTRGPCDSACAAFSDGPVARTAATYQSARRAALRRLPRTGIIESALATTDSTLSDGARFHAYTVDATAGQTLRATMVSAEFDSFIAVLRTEGDSLALIASDDDSGEGVHALLEWPVDRTGTYVVVATSFARTSLGPYYLHVEPGSASGADAFRASAANVAVRPQLTLAMTATPRVLTVGTTVNAAFADNTARMTGRGRFHAYRFRAAAAGRVAVTMTAAFDTYLYVARIDGRQAHLLGMDDDGGGGTNSRVVTTLPGPGEYLIIASAFNPTDTSRAREYSLRVEPCVGECPAAPVATPATQGAQPAPSASTGPTPLTANNDAWRESGRRVARATQRTLTLDEEIRGNLSARDSTLSDGTFFEAYTFEAAAGQTVRAVMQSNEFDPFLALFRVDGATVTVVTSNDDGGGGTTSLIELTLDRGGRFLVVANALSPNSSGSYTLTVTLHNNQRRDQ